MGKKRADKSRKPGGGRKKLKPEYDAGKNLKEQMDAAVALYEEDCSLQSIADALALNPIKVRKLLITAGVYAALDICKRSRAKSTDAAGTAVCGPLAGNAGKECGAAALGRCWNRKKLYGWLHSQRPDGAGNSSLHDEFCPDHE